MVNDTNTTYKQLNRLTIARIMAGKKIDKRVYTCEQIFNIQRLVNTTKKGFIAY